MTYLTMLLGLALLVALACLVGLGVVYFRLVGSLTPEEIEATNRL